MAGKFMKGALVSFMPTFIGSLPNVIVFQFNPETITHTWTPASPDQARASTDPLAVKGVPGEQFSFSLAVDSSDMIADAAANPVGAGLAFASGVYSRLAALEMLQYPLPTKDQGLFGTVSVSIGAGGVSASASGASTQKAAVPRSEVPTVIFVWGPERIVPVRVTALTITEKLYDPLLNPTHADVQITLKVLTPDELKGIKSELATIANVAYKYSQGLRQALAIANLGDAAASIIGMLPSPF
jgi:hypothetical protein